jgi:hypothetical protein
LISSFGGFFAAITDFLYILSSRFRDPRMAKNDLFFLFTLCPIRLPCALCSLRFSTSP